MPHADLISHERGEPELEITFLSPHLSNVSIDRPNKSTFDCCDGASLVPVFRFTASSHGMRMALSFVLVCVLSWMPRGLPRLLTVTDSDCVRRVADSLIGQLKVASESP